MGSCVSRSGAAAMSTTAESVSVHALTAKVVDLDGSMAQFAPPVTAHEALAATATAGGGGAAPPPSSSSRFLCCSDALDFDAPITALAAHDALRPGQLYFALPSSMLGRPLSAQDMAALAVKACAALGTAPVVVAPTDVAAASSARSSSLDRSAGAAGAASNRQQRWQATGKVAPLVVVVSADARGEWKIPVHGAYKDARIVARGGGGETVGKARNGVGYKGVARDLASVQRLSVIVEAASE